MAQLPLKRPIPRVLLAPEWTGGQIDHRLIIDVTHTDLHPFSKARATSEIASKDCAREAVLRSVGELERLVLATGANDRGDGAEDFLARQPHVVPHVGEHMRRQYATGWLAADRA